MICFWNSGRGRLSTDGFSPCSRAVTSHNLSVQLPVHAAQPICVPEQLEEARALLPGRFDVPSPRQVLHALLAEAQQRGARRVAYRLYGAKRHAWAGSDVDVAAVISRAMCIPARCVALVEGAGR